MATTKTLHMALDHKKRFGQKKVKITHRYNLKYTQYACGGFLWDVDIAVCKYAHKCRSVIYNMTTEIPNWLSFYIELHLAVQYSEKCCVQMPELRIQDTHMFCYENGNMKINKCLCFQKRWSDVLRFAGDIDGDLLKIEGTLSYMPFPPVLQCLVEPSLMQPPQSPELNPMQKLWNEMDCRVKVKGPTSHF